MEFLCFPKTNLIPLDDSVYQTMTNSKLRENRYD